MASNLRHRRQNSQPTLAQHLAPSYKRRRRGNSLGDIYEYEMPMTTGPSFPILLPSTMAPDTKLVSITNAQQHQAHSICDAQKHAEAKPGSTEPPQTPKRQVQAQQPTPQTTPTQTGPDSAALQRLYSAIQENYGNDPALYHQILNALPTPEASPQKPAPLVLSDSIDLAPMPSTFDDINQISLDPPLFNDYTLESPESPYEPSLYSSDAFSPGRSPSSSPMQKSLSSFSQPQPQKSIQNFMSQMQQFAFPMSNASQNSSLADEFDIFASPLQSPTSPMNKQLMEMQLDGSVQETGIPPEEIQRYMSEQDPITNKWTCQYPGCNKEFGRKENIRSHIQTHLGDRQYKCNSCGKCFVRIHDLKRHSKIHSGDKPCVCACGSRFARQDALTRHRQRGMCSGGIFNPNRVEKKRGRPKKNRPDLVARVEKAVKTREALAITEASHEAFQSVAEAASSPISQDSPLSSHASPASIESLESELLDLCGPMSPARDLLGDIALPPLSWEGVEMASLPSELTMF
jgi:regulatory protein SWI5